MIKLTKLFALLFVATLLMSSCGNKKLSKTDDTSTSMAAVDTRKMLTNGSWVLDMVEGQEVQFPAGQQDAMLTFGEGGDVSGFAGCNPLSGTYTLEDGLRLRFSDVAVGLSMCENSDTERAFLDVLNTADNFTINNNQLMLTIGRRAPMAMLSRQLEDEN